MINVVKYYRDLKNISRYLGLKASVISFTKIGNRYVCLLKVSSQKKIMLEATSGENRLSIGDKGILVIRRVKESQKEDPIVYGLKFKKLG